MQFCYSMNVSNELIQGCISKDRKAQFELYKECYSVLLSVCFRYKNNKEDAEEMLNIGFLKILNSMDKYSSNVPFEAWIRRIMINTLIDEFRKSKKERENLEYADLKESGLDNKQSDLNSADLQFDAEELEQLLKQLPDMSCKVFNLYAIDGYSHKEIADMLGISVGTSKWHVSFSRAELKKKIEHKRINKKTSP